MVDLKAPLLFKDLFTYIAPSITASRNDWDNTEDSHRIYPSSTTKSKFFTSFEHCRSACEADPLCFQFVFQATSCAIAHTIRIGREKVLQRSEGRDGRVVLEERAFSGWMVERIKMWAGEGEGACRDGARWVRSRP